MRILLERLLLPQGFAPDRIDVLVILRLGTSRVNTWTFTHHLQMNFLRLSMTMQMPTKRDYLGHHGNLSAWDAMTVVQLLDMLMILATAAQSLTLQGCLRNLLLSIELCLTF